VCGRLLSSVSDLPIPLRESRQLHRAAGNVIGCGRFRNALALRQAPRQKRMGPSRAEDLGDFSGSDLQNSAKAFAVVV
jgi:hypothetical protein